MTDIATNFESLTRAPATAGGDFLRSIPGWPMFDTTKELTAVEQIQIRLADIAAEDRRQEASLRERIGLLAEDIADEMDGVEVTAADIKAERELSDRIREECAPTVSHTPTVIMIDKKSGGERLITEPLAEAERWECTAYDENKRIAWLDYLHWNDEAVAAGAAASKARFEARKAEEAEKKANPQPKKVKLDKNGNAVPMPDHVLAKLNAPKMHRRKVAQRLREYDSNGPRISSDRRRLPFKESFRNSACVGTALRSRLGIRGLQLFNSRLPKEPLVGYDKRAVFVGTEIMEPIFCRDMDYITIGWWTVRGQVVVDLDRNFRSLRALRRKLMEILGPTLMPTLIVYALTADGQIERPHLLWILPPGSEAGICGKSRAAPIRTFEMVHQDVVSALIELGADCGHANTGKIKNPLSPKWCVACEENFPDLGDFLRELPTVSTNKREMRRRQADFQNKPVDEIKESQRNLNISKDIILAVRARAQRANSRAYKDSLASSTLHAKWLKEHAVPRIIQALCYTPKTPLKKCHEKDCPQEIRQLLAQQIEYWSGKRPSKKTKQYDGDNRFRDRGLQKELGLVGAVRPEDRKLQGLAKKSLAAIETNRGHREKSLAIMEEQIGLFQRARGDVGDKPAVISWIRKSGKLSKSTVYDLIDVALSCFRAASRYIATPFSRLNPDPFPLLQPLQSPCLRLRWSSSPPSSALPSQRPAPAIRAKTQTNLPSCLRRHRRRRSPSVLILRSVRLPVGSPLGPRCLRSLCRRPGLIAVVGSSISSPTARCTATIQPSSSSPCRNDAGARAAGPPARRSRSLRPHAPNLRKH
jgi:hypothetical protein